MSLLMTAKAAGLNLPEYFRDVLLQDLDLLGCAFPHTTRLEGALGTRGQGPPAILDLLLAQP